MEVVAAAAMGLEPLKLFCLAAHPMRRRAELLKIPETSRVGQEVWGDRFFLADSLGRAALLEL